MFNFGLGWRGRGTFLELHENLNREKKKKNTLKIKILGRGGGSDLTFLFLESLTECKRPIIVTGLIWTSYSLDPSRVEIPFRVCVGVASFGFLAFGIKDPVRPP